MAFLCFCYVGIFRACSGRIWRHIALAVTVFLYCHLGIWVWDDYIGLGSDFDGIDDNLELNNCSQMEFLAQELKKCGFCSSEIEQIFYKNVLEFYKELL